MQTNSRFKNLKPVFKNNNSFKKKSFKNEKQSNRFDCLKSNSENENVFKKKN